MSRGRLKTAAFGILTLIAAGVCIRLGIWQLDRLAQRRAQNAIVAARGAEPLAGLSSLLGRDTTEIHWRRVHLRGVADYAHEMAHATRSQAGSPGVHLLTPVRPLDGDWGDTAVLVIRGFVYAADGRRFDRDKAREGDTLEFDALVTSFPPARIGTVRMPSDARAVRLLDRDTLSVMMDRPLAPFVLLALGDTTMVDIAKAARVSPPSITEGPHQSYALQWFGFALVFVLGYLAFAFGGRFRSSPSEAERE